MRSEVNKTGGSIAAYFNGFVYRCSVILDHAVAVIIDDLFVCQLYVTYVSHVVINNKPVLHHVLERKQRGIFLVVHQTHLFLSVLSAVIIPLNREKSNRFCI